MQRWLGGTVVDWSMIVIYISYFIVPPAVAIALWLRRTGFKEFVLATLITYAIGLAFHYTVPTAPPWLAAFEGHIPPIERILFTVAAPAAPQIHEAGYQASQNDVAAMPSMHIAVTTLACLGLWHIHRRFVAVALLYALLMTVSVVYLGEHYLVDALAGAALAAAAWIAVRGLTRPRGHHQPRDVIESARISGSASETIPNRAGV
jgi:membrane-associated phospholipid phosphatase